MGRPHMRIILAAPQYKAVTWHGLTLHIPHNHVAVAADSDGWVYSYSTVPRLSKAPLWSAEHFDVCQVDLEGMPWQETLVEYAV